MRFLLSSMLCVSLLGLAVSPAGAFEFTLADNAAAIQVSGGDWFPTFDASWSVNDELVLLQTFGLTAPLPGDEDANTLGFPLANTNLDPRPDASGMLIGTEGFSGLVSLVLRGGTFDSDLSDVAEILELSNTGTSVLTFFQSVDFGARDVSIQEINENTVQASGVDFFFEEVVTPGWDRLLIDEEVEPGASGVYVLEWDIAPGESFFISKDLRIQVPEAGTGLLLAAAMLGLATRRGWIR